jgi:hypothetical protein
MRPTDPLRPLVDPGVQRQRVRLLVTIVLLGTVAAIVYHYSQAFYLGKTYPESTFLFRPADHFNDWNNSYIYAQTFLRGENAPFIYFPFAFFAMVVATLIPMRVGLALLVLAFLLVLVVMLKDYVVQVVEPWSKKVQYIFVLVFLSYPVIFVLDRSNLELLLFVFLAGFFYFLYVRESPWLAALFLAAAIAFKLYPATLLLLLLAERRYKTFTLSVVLAAVLTLAGLLALSALGHHGLAEVWRMSTGEKDVYQANMVLSSAGLQHGHTLWGLWRLPGFLHGKPIDAWKLTAYEVGAGLIFVLIALHVVFRETERWKRVLLSVVPALLLPFVSGDYTLIHLYFPLVFFIGSPRVSRWDPMYVLLFGVLLIPVDYHYLALNADGVSVSVIVYPVAMVALVILAMVDRERSPIPVTGDGTAAVARRERDVGAGA